MPWAGEEEICFGADLGRDLFWKFPNFHIKLIYVESTVNANINPAVYWNILENKSSRQAKQYFWTEVYSFYLLVSSVWEHAINKV